MGGAPMPQSVIQNSRETWMSSRWRHATVIVLCLAVLGMLVWRLEQILSPLLLSLTIAYILDPAVAWLESKGLPRLLIVIGVFTLLIAALIGAIVIIVPELVFQIQDFVRWIADRSGDINRLIHQRFSPERAAKITSQVQSTLGTYSGKVVQYVFNYLTTILSSAFVMINLGILIPVYTFFFLWRFDRITATGRRFLPKKYKERLLHVLGQINDIMANFFRGRLLVCLAVGVITAAGFQIAGVPFAWPLGLAIGVLNLVPFLAPFVGLPPVLLICYISSGGWHLPITATIAFSVAQIIDGWLLTPFIQGKLIGLHPITTIVVLLIGGELAGLFGMLLAIPAAAAIKIVFKEFVWPTVAEAADIDVQAIEKNNNDADAQPAALESNEKKEESENERKG
jgi:predicted PurR-regulated permease PerM